MGSTPYLTYVYLPSSNLVSARATSLLVRTQSARQVDDARELDGVIAVPGPGDGGFVI